MFSFKGNFVLIIFYIRVEEHIDGHLAVSKYFSIRRHLKYLLKVMQVQVPEVLYNDVL